jgi:hypothetical protein
MKAIDYSELESKFDCACQNVIASLSSQYKEHYHGAGPGKLEAFFELIKSEFDHVVTIFTNDNGINEDKEALQRIQSMAKNHAKKCIDDYGRVG